MATDSCQPQPGRKRKTKTSGDIKSKDGTPDESQGQVEIENLTASGHKALQKGDCAEALDCFKKAFKGATKLKKTKVQQACALNLGAAYVEAGKPQKGLDFLSRAQPGERGERMADLQFNLAVAHEALEDYTSAAKHYLQAAQLYRSQGDGCSEGDTCMKLARCYLRAKDWVQAVESFQRAGDSYRVAGRLDSAAVALKETGTNMLHCDRFSADDIITVFTDCLELSVSITDKEMLGKLYNDVGLSFSQLKLFTEAAECYEQALPLVSTKPHRLAVVLQNLGAVHNTLGQYRQALDYHREAASLHGSLGSRRAQGRCFSNLGYALSQLGELEEAGESYLHAQQAFKDTDDHMGHWQVCEGLGEIRLQLRDPDKATFYFKQALALLSKCKDSPVSAQERLVSKLSEALQYKLSLHQVKLRRNLSPLIPKSALQRSPIRHRMTQERHPQRQQLRLVDMKSSENQFGQQPRKELLNGHVREDASQERGEEQREFPGTYRQNNPHPDQVMSSAQMMSDSCPKGPHLEHPDYLSVLPEANRNLNNTYEKPDMHYQSPHDSSGIPQEDNRLPEMITEKTMEMNR
ncbi:tetratricopeptide repeat protein 24 [Chanos chanos]|uniref:Tetratricopeptide repeat protein 24 n=1 Tax=Chanos chanos TaxID=29144 RepID=A0A6J2W0Y7_CHACN|nr:tetratricopeptide repeat protein 24 [Chanos chanos]